MTGRATRGGGRAAGRSLRIAAALAASLASGLPAAAQEGAVGPCSPYRAADGDIPSEMPGCARRLRPAPGSLADELQFRRGRKGEDGIDGATLDEDAPVPARGGRHARRPPSP